MIGELGRSRGKAQGAGPEHGGAGRSRGGARGE